MIYAFEMDSGDMIHLQSCMKIDSGIHKVLGGTDTQTER
jgi:hypothetical protein